MLDEKCLMRVQQWGLMKIDWRSAIGPDPCGDVHGQDPIQSKPISRLTQQQARKENKQFTKTRRIDMSSRNTFSYLELSCWCCAHVNSYPWSPTTLSEPSLTQRSEPSSAQPTQSLDGANLDIQNPIGNSGTHRGMSCCTTVSVQICHNPRRNV
jgi:hypothetical protein